MCGNEFQWLEACANLTLNADLFIKLSELFTEGKLSNKKKENSQAKKLFLKI